VHDFACRFVCNDGLPVCADLDGSINGYSSLQAGQLVASGDTIFCDRFQWQLQGASERVAWSSQR
jgi:hypothetical protein